MTNRTKPERPTLERVVMTAGYLLLSILLLTALSATWVGLDYLIGGTGLLVVQTVVILGWVVSMAWRRSR